MRIQTKAGTARMVDIVPRKMKLNGNGVTRSEPRTPNRRASGNPRTVPVNPMTMVTTLAPTIPFCSTRLRTSVPGLSKLW
jgi:hypothetical protein